MGIFNDKYEEYIFLLEKDLITITSTINPVITTIDQAREFVNKFVNIAKMQNKAREIANGMLIFANYDHQIRIGDDSEIYVSSFVYNGKYNLDEFAQLVTLWPEDFPEDEKNQLERSNWYQQGSFWVYKSI